MKNYILALALLSATACHRSAPQEEIMAIQIQDSNGLTETINASDRLEVYQNIDFLSSQPYKKVLRIYRKEGKSHSKISTYHPNGMPWQYLEAQEMRAYGAYREWFPNGQLKIEATVIGGTADVVLGAQQDWLFEGLSQVWDERGNLTAKIPYSKGALEGTSLYFYPDGKKQKEVPFSKNVIQGELREYFSDETLLSTTHYKNGVKEGASVGYFSNRQVAWNEDYSDGLLRTGTYYTQAGELFSEVLNGGGFQAQFSNDRLFYLIEMRHGRPEGRWQKYTPKGDLVSVSHIKNDQQEGEEIHYYLPSERESVGPSLLPKLSIPWHENKVHGTVQTWYTNGQIESQREYCRNKKMGPSLAWYKDGSLMMLEEYEEDRLVKGHYYKKHHKDPVSSIFNGTGVATLYDAEGIFLRKVIYSKGKTIDPED